MAETTKETILVAEDADSVRKMVCIMLAQSGYVVLEACDGREALQMFQPGGVHLLLTDIVMPHMSGIELARSITRISPETRILFMSGYTDDAAVRAVANTPTFIAKPFTAATLVAKVRRALELPWTGLPEQTSGAE